MRTQAFRILLAGALVAAALVAPGAFAGKPTIERFDVDEVFLDEGLTEACGVTVMTRAQGHVTVRTFSGQGAGPAQIRTLNIALTATAGDNTYRFRDVGADHVQVKKDGTEILMIIGQVPFDFTGVLKINLTTGEAIHEPQHMTADRIEDACAALTA
jgi:hypothetical protein